MALNVKNCYIKILLVIIKKSNMDQVLSFPYSNVEMFHVQMFEDRDDQETLRCKAWLGFSAVVM